MTVQQVSRVLSRCTLIGGVVTHKAGVAGHCISGIPGARAQASRALHGGGALLSHCKLGAGVPQLGSLTQTGVIQRLFRRPSSYLHPAGRLEVNSGWCLTTRGFWGRGVAKGVGGPWCVVMGDFQKEHCTLCFGSFL